MISGDQIQELIANPSAINGEQLSDLKTLGDKYIYCSSLHILVLKGMALHNDLNFENQLKKTAAHIPDRAHLFELIHSDGKLQDMSGSIDTSVPLPGTELGDQDEKTPETSVLQSSSELSARDEVNEEERIVNELASDVDLALEQNILTEAIDQSYVEDVLATPEVDDVPVIDGADSDDQKDEKQSLHLESTEADDSQAEPLSFIEWLKLKQAGTSVLRQESGHSDRDKLNEEVENGENEVDDTSVLRQGSGLSARTEDEGEDISETKRKSKTDLLLEKFIAEEPKISRPTKDFYNPVKTAKKSIEEPDDLVSETLAKIHLMQKNYDKAIDAYQKLILLYPEKKVFFANQIKKIEEIKKK